MSSAVSPFGRERYQERQQAGKAANGYPEPPRRSLLRSIVCYFNNHQPGRAYRYKPAPPPNFRGEGWYRQDCEYCGSELRFWNADAWG